MSVIERNRAVAGSEALSTRPSLRRAKRLFQRNLLVYRHTWTVIFSGFFEPLFYLVGLGYGLGRLVGKIDGLSYPEFVAPGLLATSCLNGAISDGFFNVFFKLNFQKTYDGILATPLGIRDIAIGEMMWALFRGSLYATAFMGVLAAMHLLLSPWAILAIPAAVLVSATFAAIALTFTSFARKIQDFDIVVGVFVMPMFLFSTTFFPISVYPKAIATILRFTPLYHGISLLRALTTGRISFNQVWDVFYLVVVLMIAMTVCMRQLERRVIR